LHGDTTNIWIKIFADWLSEVYGLIKKK